MNFKHYIQRREFVGESSFQSRCRKGIQQCLGHISHGLLAVRVLFPETLRIPNLRIVKSTGLGTSDSLNVPVASSVLLPSEGIMTAREAVCRFLGLQNAF